jgi:hypothetical protein
LPAAITWCKNRAKRLERYAVKVRENLWSGDRDRAVTALADCPETGEIARRLYLMLQTRLNPPATTA